MAKINRAAFTRGRGPVFGQEAIYADPRVQMAQRMVLDKPNRPIHTVGGGLAQMGEQWTNALALTLAENRARQEQEERAEKLAKSLVGPMPTPAGQGPRTGNVDAQKAYAERLRQYKEGLQSGAIPPELAQQAIARRMHPELFQPDPKYFKVGNNLIRAQGDTATPVYEGPAGPPKTRTIQRGMNRVTQQWNPQTQQFEDIAEGPRFSPNALVKVQTGGERPVIQPPKPPKGFHWAIDPNDPTRYDKKLDPKTGREEWYLVPTPGGQEARDIEAEDRSIANKIDRQLRQADNVFGAINKLDVMVRDQSWWDRAVGLGHKLGKPFSGSATNDAAALIDQIGSNVAFNKLQELRDDSPTGGAIGQVSNFEQKMLMSVLGSLERSQSPEQFRWNLMRVKQAFYDVVHGSPARLRELLDQKKITRRQYDEVMRHRPTASNPKLEGKSVSEMEQMMIDGKITQEELIKELDARGY